MAMPESIPAPLIIDTYKDIFRAERNGARRKDPLAGSSACPTRTRRRCWPPSTRSAM